MKMGLQTTNCNAILPSSKKLMSKIVRPLNSASECSTYDQGHLKRGL